MKLYERFVSSTHSLQVKELLSKPSLYWQQQGAKKALLVFKEAARRVPAYKLFLKSEGIDYRTIRTFEDFKKVPIVNKKNYLQKYSLPELCWDGSLSRMNVISSSSGTSGKAFYWPRNFLQEQEVDHYYYLTLKEIFGADKKNSLVIIAFAMGMYVAGPFTFSSLLRLSKSGLKIVQATTSNDIELILKVVKNLSGHFKQLIIGGYPPFIKDIIDAGIDNKVNWHNKSLGLFFGGEGFTEKWREELQHSIGKTRTYGDIYNMYGSADAGLLGIETPQSIALRKRFSNDGSLKKRFFGDRLLPTVVSYNPLFKYFEVIEENKLIFTSSSGIPLIRYAIGDSGGILTHEEMEAEIPRLRLNPRFNWKLPLVYLFGRSDHTVIIYGANIYPENIKEALLLSRLKNKVSGKFIMRKVDQGSKGKLSIIVELARGVRKRKLLTDLIKSQITEHLLKTNAEYKDAYRATKNKIAPQVVTKLFGEERFRINIKHQWTQ